MPASPIWKVASGCSESEVLGIARQLSNVLSRGHRILLEGPMGVGKTTFTRQLLLGLGVVQPPEGSPSFAIAHEYRSPRGEVIHIDFYRIRAESEIEEAGIEAYFWERDAIVIAEWTSLWPAFEHAVLESKGRVPTSLKIWRVNLEFDPQDPARREITIREA